MSVGGQETLLRGHFSPSACDPETWPLTCTTVWSHATAYGHNQAWTGQKSWTRLVSTEEVPT